MKRYRSMLALLLAVVMLAGMALSSGFTLRAGGTFLTEVFEEEDAGYKTYTNDDVLFTLEYPAGYDIDEPYDNLVLISSGDNFRVVAEYAYTTADGNRFIYSAADFAAMIDADRQVLADWLGVSDFDVVNTGHGTVAGKECYEYDFALVLNGNQCSGSLLIFNGQGDFGCYCLQTMINEDSPNADKYLEQQIHLVETFQVTGPYQELGFGLTHDDDKDMSFISPMFYKSSSSSLSSSYFSIYPLDHIIIEGNIGIRETAYEASDGYEKASKGCANYYFEYEEQTQYVSEPGAVGLGRYDYTAVQLRYLHEDTWLNLVQVLFLHDGNYWELKMVSSDENMEAMTAFTRSVLASLCFDDDIPKPTTSGTRKTVPAKDAAPAAEETAAAPAGEGYSTYTNDTVCFSFEYPAGLTVTEPFPGAVLMESGDGSLRMSAEYTYTTVDGATLLYSATDFADLIDADQGVLAGWLGTDDFTLGYHDRDTSGERAVCWYFFDVEQNGKTLQGSLTLFDGAGRFGCYCLQTLCDKETYGSVEYEQQLAHAQETFQVTKACEVAGLTVRHIDAWDLDFITRDTLVKDVGFESYPETGDVVNIYPSAEGVTFSMSPLIYDADEVSMDEAVSSSLDFYLSSKDLAQVISEPTHISGVGRYDFDNFVVAYTENGEAVYVLNTFLLVDGRYWEISARFHDGDEETVDSIVSEMLSSLRFN